MMGTRGTGSKVAAHDSMPHVPPHHGISETALQLCTLNVHMDEFRKLIQKLMLS